MTDQEKPKPPETVTEAGGFDAYFRAHGHDPDRIVQRMYPHLVNTKGAEMEGDFDALTEKGARILQAQEEREFQEAIAAAGGIDAFLRQHGYDPDEVGRRMNAVAQQALREMEDALETVDRIAQRLGVAFSIETRYEIAAMINNRGIYPAPDNET
jgi:hypothetical protein